MKRGRLEVSWYGAWLIPKLAMILWDDVVVATGVTREGVVRVWSVIAEAERDGRGLTLTAADVSRAAYGR